MLSFIVSFFSKIVILMLRTQSGGSFPPPLGKAEERELFRRMKGGDKDARNKLIEHNLRLVAHIVKKYYASCKDQEDLISVGTVGLIKAIDSFDPENGAGFATYAGKCLQNEILMYFRAQKKTLLESSLNDPVDTDKDGNPLTYMDILCSDEDIAEEIDAKIKTSLVNRAVREKLSDRERKIIALRYGMSPDGRCLAQREVASLLGISRSYVSRIEKTALDKIRAYIFAGGA
ncbi:MAG: RNA polymerase sporulation sigma factor SigK [Clostridia bacterium]|nr:RNA polymerase sporulation sigma factor SigK [Clostridia bacterium]